MTATAQRSATNYEHHDRESEQAILGALLAAGSTWAQDRDLADPALAMLQPHDFYRWAHQAIYRAVQGVVAAGNPPSLVFTFDELQRTGTSDDALAPGYLGELVAAYQWELCHATQHARVVRTAGFQRRLGEAADAGDMAGITAATQGLAALGVSSSDDFPTMREAMSAYFEMMGDDTGQSVRTGIPSLDRTTGGFRPGNLIGIGARPGVGKSAMGLSIAYHASVKQNIPVGFLSLEMSTHEINQRLIAMDAAVATTDARIPSGPVIDAIGRLSERPLFVRRPGSSVGDVLAIAGPLVKQHGCKLIIIDYLQLMTAGPRQDNRPQEIATITREVKNWAQMSEVPVILLTQLKRDPNHKGAPRLEDIADSDSLARDADIILFLHPGDDAGATATQPVDLLIAKHRNGPTGSVAMQFVRKTTRFVETEWRS